MESPGRYGLVVFSVSASVAVLLHHLHKRMVSDFINKLEFHISSGNCEKGQGKKKVRFAEKVIEVPAEEEELKGAMPPNREALYRGIIKHRTLHTKFHS